MSQNHVVVKSSRSKFVTKNDADRALRRFKADGFDVNPDDTTQLTACIQMRALRARVQPGEFVAAMKNTKVDQSAVSSQTIQYWGGPKANFAQGVPKEM